MLLLTYPSILFLSYPFAPSETACTARGLFTSSQSVSQSVQSPSSPSQSLASLFPGLSCPPPVLFQPFFAPLKFCKFSEIFCCSLRSSRPPVSHPSLPSRLAINLVFFHARYNPILFRHKMHPAATRRYIYWFSLAETFSTTSATHPSVVRPLGKPP